MRFLYRILFFKILIYCEMTRIVVFITWLYKATWSKYVISKVGKPHKSMFLFLIEWFRSTVALVFCMKYPKHSQSYKIGTYLLIPVHTLICSGYLFIWLLNICYKMQHALIKWRIFTQLQSIKQFRSSCFM